MLTDEDLNRMLSGGDGVCALDAAREIRDLRQSCAGMTAQLAQMNAELVRHHEVEEQLMLARADAEQRHHSLLEALAGMVAQHRDA